MFFFLYNVSPSVLFISTAPLTPFSFTLFQPTPPACPYTRNSALAGRRMHRPI